MVKMIFFIKNGLLIKKRGVGFLKILSSHFFFWWERQIPTVYLPEVFRLAAEGKLTIATATAPLKDIENVWQQENGRRMVIVI